MCDRSARSSIPLVLAGAVTVCLVAPVGLTAGCSVPTSEVSRPGECEPFQLTAVLPAPDAQDIPPDVTVAVTFTDFPEPETVNSSNLSLFTGFYYHTGRYWVDLVERRALFKPSSTLQTGLGYTILLRPGVRSLRGCALQAPPPLADGRPATGYDFRFQTVADGADRRPVPVPAPSATYADVTAVFGAHCAGGACHLATTPGTGAPPLPSPADWRCLSTPGGGLSLCPRDARGALVGVPSRQIDPLVLVAASDSAHSYLLRKIIGAPPLVGHSGVPNDNLSQDEKHVIEDWIDTGAPSAPQPGDGGI